MRCSGSQRSGKQRLTGLTAGLAVCCVCILAIAVASPIKTGLDSYQTLDASMDSTATQIPLGFFDPGSDPFPDTIPLQGSPLGPGATTDTMVERLATAKPHGPNHTDTIPIRIAALSLTSTSAITVTYNGGLNPELWDVRAGLSPATQPLGTMTITENSGKVTSGSFDSFLPVLARLTFTRQSDGAVRVYDLPELDLRSRVVPWTSATTTTTVIHSKGFCPACDSPDGTPANMFENAQGSQFDLVPAQTVP
jgi:hypothetical protein